MALSNEQLFDLIKDGNEDFKPILWERVKNLAYMLASQFYRRNGDLCRSRGLEEWDIKQLSYLAYASLFESYNTEKKYGYTTALGYALSRQLREALGKGADTLNRIASSLDEIIGDEEDGRTVADLIADEDSSAPFEQIEDSSEQEYKHKILQEEIDKLPEREQAVINGKYYGGKTLQELSKDMNVSGERVGQLHRSAIRHLRAKSNRIWRRLTEDFGYSSYRIYNGRNNVEYIATERVYLEELYKQYTEEQEDNLRLAAAASWK